MYAKLVKSLFRDLNGACKQARMYQPRWVLRVMERQFRFIDIWSNDLIFKLLLFQILLAVGLL